MKNDFGNKMAKLARVESFREHRRLKKNIGKQGPSIKSNPVTQGNGFVMYDAEFSKARGAVSSSRASIAKSAGRQVRGKALAGFGRKLTSISNIFGWTTFANIGVQLASSALRSGQAFRTTKEQMAKENFKSQNDQGTYYDTRAAYTQRQRALQVIHNSRLSLQPMLGSESNYLHY